MSVYDSLICYYDIKKLGCSNEGIQASPILKDLSGNGNSLYLNNFSWKIDNGVGKQTTDFTTWINSGQTIVSSTKVILTTVGNTNSYFFIRNWEDINTLTIKVSGMTDDITRLELGSGTISESERTIYSDGIYVLNISDITKDLISGTNAIGFKVYSDTAETCSITIEQYEIPCLISNGVDNYGVCTTLPILTDFTIIIDRDINDVSKADSMSVVKGETSTGVVNFTFVLDGTNYLVQPIYGNFGSYISPSKDYLSQSVLIMTPTLLLSGELSTTQTKGSRVDLTSDYLYLFGTLNKEHTNRFGKISLRKFLLFDRTLDSDEINYVLNSIDSVEFDTKCYFGEKEITKIMFGDYQDTTDLSSKECWNIYKGEEKVYHKNKTVENCWLEYGAATKEDSRITIDFANKDSSIITNTLPEVTDWKEYVFPTSNSEKLPLAWNSQIDNTDFWDQLKEYLNENAFYYDESDTENSCINVFSNTHKWFKNSNISGELTIKLDGSFTDLLIADTFSNSNSSEYTQLEKITFQALSDDIRLKLGTHVFYRCLILTDIEVIDSNGNTKNDLFWIPSDSYYGLFEGLSTMTVFPDIIDYGYRDSNGFQTLYYFWATCLNLITISMHGDDRYSDANTIKVGDNAMAKLCFLNNTKLIYIGPVLDLEYVNLSEIEDSSSIGYRMFYSCNALEDVRIKNLNGSYANFASDNQLGYLKSLNQESIEYLFDNLKDLTTYNGDASGTNAHAESGKLVCPEEWREYITDSMVLSAANKNWAIYINDELLEVTIRNYSNDYDESYN